MPYFQIERIYYEYQTISTKKFETYFDSTKTRTLVLPENNGDTNPKETFTQTIFNAQKAKADFFIVGKMKAYKDVITISMTLYSSVDSSNLWTDTLIARTTQDLNPILKLFADYIGTDKKASIVNNTFALQNYYPQELIKTDATTYFGLTPSAAYFSARKAKNGFTGGYGFAFSYDLNDKILDLQMDYFPGDYHGCIIQYFDLKASYLYPLRTIKESAFIGGGIGYSAIRITYPNPNPNSFFTEERADGMGLTLFLNGGYLFNRNSKLKFRLAGSVALAIYSTKAYNSGGSMMPVGFMLNGFMLIPLIKK